jgi:hypothetical protein
MNKNIPLQATINKKTTLINYPNMLSVGVKGGLK